MKERSIFVRINVSERLPEFNGTYIVSLRYPNGDVSTKKVFFLGGKWCLKNGRKDCEVINWFKRIVIEEQNYLQLLDAVPA